MGQTTGIEWTDHKAGNKEIDQSLALAQELKEKLIRLEHEAQILNLNLEHQKQILKLQLELDLTKVALALAERKAEHGTNYGN